MNSLRRIQASRRNGARSREPKTPAGKSRSSQNAIRHGLLAKGTVLSNESQENFQALLDQHIERFAPLDGVAFGMIEEMASSCWRLRRAWIIEKDLFDKALASHPEDDDLSSLSRAWIELADSPQLVNIGRYQTALHRMHQRALFNLLLLRDTNPKTATLQNEPSPISGHPAALPPAATPE